ncbi:hypothetical protein I5M32_08715 [Pedobacter sp. SD-b]|uniref:Peptidase family C25 n=1 Tax=Pedobacter segetis TaxID=2793069 RepID=A0ABS1BJI1_9SPHI|nr:C25 family cysteine peptidase [Pedobacter segetis]MBK0383039.1 hypothetical protein [Pedobacter segetis]
MLKRFSVFLSLIMVSFCSYAQKYGNEWIDFSLKYSKITITEEGLYKITYDDVVSKALQNGVLDPNKFQLFNKGLEIPLNITGAQDGVFNQGDEIYFYGTKNNASLDKVLYTNQADLPNDDVSLFTDENYYFLTYNPSKNGLRYQIYNLSTNGLTPENSVIANSRLNFNSNYYPGAYILDAMSLSEYIEGEGYLGATLSKGQTVNYQLNTSNYINSGYQSKISFYVAGRSNAASTNSTGNNHHFRVSFNNSSLFDSLYRSYGTIRKTTPININSSVTNISFSSIDDLGAVTDFQAPGYLEVNYGRDLNLNGLKSLSFKVDTPKPLMLLSFSNINLTTPLIIEKNGINLFTSSGPGQFVLKDATLGTDYLLTDQSLAKGVALSDVTFKNINTNTSKTYLIISNNLLKDGAEAYQSYNQSIGMPTSVVYTDDLYNEFYYGFHHPLALRNYCRYMVDKGNVKPEYLLLLGKGQEYPKLSINNDLVPTMGFPASDNMLTSGLNGSNLEPGLATGRIPATENLDVLNYLEKLKVYNNLPDSLWRKKMQFISGGRTLSENLSFQGYQNSLAQLATGEFFGAKPVYIKKNVNSPVTENFTDLIVKETKLGTGLISYLGHGSTITTEIIMGEPSTLGNQDKPTIYLVNGCSTGNAFTEVRSLGEKFLLQKDFGAVAWIGTTSEGVASYLNGASLKFYNNWFVSNYGLSLAKGIKYGLNLFQNSNDKLNLAHLRQYILLGDPYLKFYSLDKPDYSISTTDIFPTIPDQNANNKNLQLSLIVKNLGKSVSDSLEIEITRNLPDGSSVKYPIYNVAPVFNSDTLKIILNNDIKGIAGNNKISIKINPNNKVAEKTLTNNDASIEVFLPSNGLNLIFPLKNSIVGSNQISLKAEPDDLFTKNASYLFEIDTIPTFTSSFKVSSPIIVADLFPTWAPNVNWENNKVYYWRARLNLPLDKGGQWSQSSFTYIKDETDGYMVSSYNELKDFELNGIETGLNYLQFLPDVFSTTIQTRGDNASNLEERRFRYGGLGLGYCTPEFSGLSIVTYDPVVTGKRFSYPSPYNCSNDSGPIIGYTGQYYWDTNNTTELDSLLSYLRQVPNGSRVIGYNGYNAAFDELPTSIKNELKNLGLSKFENVKRGEPYMFWGVKGSLPGTAIEETADYNSTINPKEQIIKKSVDLIYKSSKGFIKSNKIGPAKKWISFNSNFFNRTSDKTTYTIIGVDKNNTEKTIYNNFDANTQDLSSIDANAYPFLKLKTNFENNDLRSIPQLKYIKVSYQPVSEISFNPEFKNEFYSNELQEGDSLRLSFGLSNLSKYQTDQINVYYQLIVNNKTLPEKLIDKIDSLKPFENSSFSLIEDTKNLSGDNIIKLSAKYENQEDAFQFNNYVTKAFTVKRDNKEPIVNVLFDGKNIINGEIVSPSPLISITSIDENKFLLMNDTTNVDVYLRGSKQDDFKRINYSSKQLNFIPSATKELNKSVINFKPDLLPDDVYTLKVKSKDNSGNGGNLPDYLTEFTVVNESSISNFYPYPNPVVNEMRFVFTLTGSKIPDKIKIQILTSSGKVVREINKNELGNLRIGNNVTDFNWDGTDQFGDRLANGIYFYKVSVEDNEKGEFKTRKTSNTPFFKNNIGKIYLLK